MKRASKPAAAKPPIIPPVTAADLDPRLLLPLPAEAGIAFTLDAVVPAGNGAWVLDDVLSEPMTTVEDI